MIRKGLTGSAIICMIALIATAVIWAAIPANEQIPVHWNLAGEPDRWASKATALLMLPVVMIVLSALLAGIPAIAPERNNLEKSAGFYLTAWFGSLLVLLVAQLGTLWAALGRNFAVEVIVPLTVGMFWMLLGNTMAKSHRNYFAGVRTPWSLESDDAWVASNRAGGWGFVGTGLLTIAACLLAPKLSIVVLLAGTTVSTVMAVVISYKVWSREQP